MHRVRDLDDLAVFRAQTSAQTAAEHINLRSIHLLCRPPQARTAAVTHLPSAPSAHPVLCGEPGRTRRRGIITVRLRAHIAHKPHAHRLTDLRGSRRRNRLLNGFYRSPLLSLPAPPGAPTEQVRTHEHRFILQLQANTNTEAEIFVL